MDFSYFNLLEKHFNIFLQPSLHPWGPTIVAMIWQLILNFSCFKTILNIFFQCWSCEWYQKLLSRLSQSNSSCFYLVSWSSSISLWFQENFHSFIIINWMSFKILLLNNKLPFDWIWQEFKRQLTKFTNARIPNQRESITAPPDRLWIISSILAKSNQNGYCNNQNHRKSKLPLKTRKKLWKLSFLKNPGNASLIGLSSFSSAPFKQSNFT